MIYIYIIKCIIVLSEFFSKMLHIMSNNVDNKYLDKISITNAFNKDLLSDVHINMQTIIKRIDFLLPHFRLKAVFGKRMNA